MSFAHFLTGLFGFLGVEFENSLIILDVNFLSDMSLANIFSHSIGCLLVLLIVFFSESLIIREENRMEGLKKLKTELPFHPVIALLGIYPKDTKTWI